MGGGCARHCPGFRRRNDQYFDRIDDQPYHHRTSTTCQNSQRRFRGYGAGDGTRRGRHRSAHISPENPALKSKGAMSKESRGECKVQSEKFKVAVVNSKLLTSCCNYSLFIFHFELIFLNPVTYNL